MKTKYVMVGMIFLIALLFSEIYVLWAQLKERESEISQLKNMLQMVEELNKTRTELNELKRELSELNKFIERSSGPDVASQVVGELVRNEVALERTREELSELKEKFLKVSEELNRTKVRIPKPKIVGEIDWEEIEEVREKIVPQGGSVCSGYRLTTKEEIERFLSIIEYPEGMDEKGKSWYLMSKFIEWTTPDYICVGLGHGAGGKIGKFIRTVFVIVQGKEGYELYWVDIEKGNKLILLEPGDLDSLVIIFP